MTHAPRTPLAAVAMLAVACGADPSARDVGVARAAVTALQVGEHAVATTADVEATPALGRDERGPLVVYASRPVLAGGGWGPGTVWYQRLRDGAPEGAPVRVSAGGTDDELDDVSGRYVVYTAWDSPGSLSGRIVVYDVGTATSRAIASASVLQEARIAGTKVAWLQGYPATLMLYDLAAGAAPAAIAGPTPSPGEIEIGDRFLVWSEVTSAQGDVRAYDLAARTRETVAARPDVDERLPSTDGPWVAFQATPAGGSATTIQLLNLDTGERRAVPGRGGKDGAPSVSGDLVAYESRLGASADVLVYRISAGDTFQVTSDAWDQRSVDVLGGLVAWVDGRLGTPDVYVATLAFVEEPCGTACGDVVGPKAALDAAIAAVRALGWGAFARPGRRAVLLSKLAAVRRMVEAGAWEGAARKLRRDLLAKTDGCVLGSGPDANDWIVSCDAQERAWEAIRGAADALERAAAPEH
jgi:hypothetical protein